MLSKLSRLLGLSRREIIALGAAFVLTLPAVTPRIYASDEIEYFAYLRSLWFDGDVSFENEYRYFYDRNVGRGENFHATFLELETDAGLRPNFATMGAALLWSPFYAIGHLVALATNGLGADVSADGFSQPYLSAVAYGSAFYGFAAVVLGASAARTIHRRWAGNYRDHADVWGAALIWAGTPLLFYMYVAPPYAHAASAFSVALFVWLWLRVRRTWSITGTAVLGLWAAVMAMVREQDLFFTLGPAADYVLTVTGTLRRRSADGAPGAAMHYLKGAAAGLAAFAIGYLPQIAAYWALNGYPGPSRIVVRKMSWHSPHALGVLASPEHGFFFWTPLALIALAGLIVLVRQRDEDVRRLAACALLMTAVQVYLSGSVESWTVAGAFGQRRFVAVTALLIIGLAAVLRAVPAGAPAIAGATAVAVCVWWNLALSAAFGTGIMNRQRLELARNLHDAFVTIPRMAPDLAMRYLTNRDSFYRQTQRHE